MDWASAEETIIQPSAVGGVQICSAAIPADRPDAIAARISCQIVVKDVGMRTVSLVALTAATLGSSDVSRISGSRAGIQDSFYASV
jgi:hypothetical protein